MIFLSWTLLFFETIIGDDVGKLHQLKMAWKDKEEWQARQAFATEKPRKINSVETRVS